DSTNLVLNSRLMECNQEIGRLQLQLAGKTGEAQALKELNAKQYKEINQLKDDKESITSQSLSQQQLMDLALQKKAEEVAEKELVIQTLQQAINEQDQKMKDLLAKIKAALERYNQENLSLEIKEGKVYVGLSDQLLFKSGSIKLEKNALSVLESIAGVLKNHPELDIIVEGHTDNVPIKSQNIKDNLELSVLRATSVVRLLTEEYDLNRSQVTAAGKGEFEPKASNETKEGKAQNRRTEIIIEPQLNEVLKMIQENVSTQGN
ncbi:MAG: flagellar motor protein MotB, partial [Saprospiraceae bacterium]